MCLLFVFGTEHYLFFLCAPLVVFPFILWVSAHVQLQGIFRSFAAWGGQISYALYITHRVLEFLLQWLYKKAGIDPYTHLYWNTALWTLLAIAIAWILDVHYDTPTRAYLSKRFIMRKASV